jgi:tRNA G10  N-methylase Trm11
MHKVEFENVTLWHADCLDVLPLLAGVDACITDPPYGMDWCFTGQGSGKGAQGGTESVTKGQRIEGDAEDFNPAHLMQFEKLVIWGFHHFPDKLKRGTVLVWVKKYPDAFGTFLSDADVAWMKGGCGVYCSPIINPASFQAEKCHPTQKPVTLMHWCFERAKVAIGGTVLDPYMGSGTTGIACIRSGRKFIGIEKDAAHFATACKRIEQELSQGQLAL